MATNIVGALAVELGLDTAQFEKGLKSLPGMAQQHFGGMSAEMKRTSREGAESFRLIDEALGIHLSRPITKLLTQEFPGLAKGLQSILGVGLTGAIAAAAFEIVSSAVEKLVQKFEQAKKAQEEYEASSRHLRETLQDVALSHEKRMEDLNAQMAALSGDKSGELTSRLKIVSIDDAELAIREMDRVAEAMERVAKAAIDAESASHRFWLQAARANSSEHNLSIEDATREFEDFKEKVKEAGKEDATKGTRVGLDLTIQKVDELDRKLAEAQSHRISDARAFVDDLGKAIGASGTKTLPGIVPERSGFTDKEILQIRSQDQEAHKFLETQKQIGEEHEKHLKLLRQQSAAEPEIGAKEIEKLKAETDAQLALAGTVGQSVAAMKLQTASGEADQLISRILEEAHGKLTARIKEEISTIHALTAERQVAKDAVDTNQELQKQITAVNQQIQSEQRLALAYKEGGDAILQAKVEEKLAPAIQKAKDLREEYERLKKAADDYAESVRKLAGAAGPKEGIKGISPEALSTAKSAVDVADRSVEELRTLATTEARQKYQIEIEQNSAALRGEQPLLDALNDAYLQNDQAVRKAQVALALYHWEQAHPGATPDQIKAVGAELDQQSINSQRLADTELAARYSITRSYEDEISRLERAREVMQQYGQSTLLIDAQIYDEQQRMIHQWDDAAFRVGSFGEKFQAVMNEVAIKGQEASQHMAQAWMTAIDGVNTELSKLLTGQKTDFKRIVLQLAQDQTKGELEKAEGWLAQQFGIKIPGIEGKPDGSASRPLHVTFGGADANKSAASPLGDVTHALGPDLKNVFSKFSSEASGGGFFSHITGAFESLGHKLSGHKDKDEDKKLLSVIVANVVPTMVTNWPATSGAGLLAGSGTAAAGGHGSLNLPSPQFSAFLAKQAGIHGGIDWRNPSANIDDIDRAYEASLHTPFGLASEAPFGAPRSIRTPNFFNSSTDLGSSSSTSGFGIGAGQGLGRSDVGTQALSKAGSDLDRAAQPLSKAGSDGDRAATALSKAGADLSAAAEALKSSGGASGSVAGSQAGSSAPDFSGFDFGGGLADGGLVRSGTHYMVGERGPELFRSSTAGDIIPNHQVADYLKQGGPQNWTFDPRSPEAIAYARHERSLHSVGGSGFGGILSALSPLLAVSGGALFKEFQKLVHPAHSRGAIAAAMPQSTGVLDELNSLTAAENFGGFRASGGDVTPGKDYIIGEKGPERLRIPFAGHITSNADLRQMNTSNRGGDTHQGPIINQTFNGVNEKDMFRRTVRQEHARMFRNLK